MSNDLCEFTDFFKDRVDALSILEQKAEERAQSLAEAAKNCLLSNESRVSKLVLRMETVADTIDKMNDTAEQVDKHIRFCSQHVKFASGLFFGSLVLSAVILIGTYLWFEHIEDQVTEAKLELAETNAKLAHKPLFLPGDKSISESQSHYGRVVSHTEETMTHQKGGPYPGGYAQIWTQ